MVRERPKEPEVSLGSENAPLASNVGALLIDLRTANVYKGLYAVIVMPVGKIAFGKSFNISASPYAIGISFAISCSSLYISLKKISGA